MHQHQHPLATVQNSPHFFQHQPTLSNKDLRDRIVEILSATANGCLTELGYFPGMTQRLQELEATNQVWQTENVKLFEDNRNLLLTVNDLQERENLIPKDDHEKINRIRDLERQLEVLKQGSIPKAKFDEMHRHFSQLRASYTTAYEEVQRLTAHLKFITSLAANSGLMLPPPPPPNRKPSAVNNAQNPESQLHPSHPPQPPPNHHPAPPAVWQGGRPFSAGIHGAAQTPSGPARSSQMSQPIAPGPNQNHDGHLLQQTQYVQVPINPHATSMEHHVRRASGSADGK